MTQSDHEDISAALYKATSTLAKVRLTARSDRLQPTPCLSSDTVSTDRTSAGAKKEKKKKKKKKKQLSHCIDKSSAELQNLIDVATTRVRAAEASKGIKLEREEIVYIAKDVVSGLAPTIKPVVISMITLLLWEKRDRIETLPMQGSSPTTTLPDDTPVLPVHEKITHPGEGITFSQATTPVPLIESADTGVNLIMPCTSEEKEVLPMSEGDEALPMDPSSTMEPVQGIEQSACEPQTIVVISNAELIGDFLDESTDLTKSTECNSQATMEGEHVTFESAFEGVMQFFDSGMGLQALDEHSMRTDDGATTDDDNTTIGSDGNYVPFDKATSPSLFSSIFGPVASYEAFPDDERYSHPITLQNVSISKESSTRNSLLLDSYLAKVLDEHDAPRKNALETIPEQDSDVNFGGIIANSEEDNGVCLPCTYECSGEKLASTSPSFFGGIFNTKARNGEELDVSSIADDNGSLDDRLDYDITFNTLVADVSLDDIGIFSTSSFAGNEVTSLNISYDEIMGRYQTGESHPPFEDYSSPITNIMDDKVMEFSPTRAEWKGRSLLTESFDSAPADEIIDGHEEKRIVTFVGDEIISDEPSASSAAETSERTVAYLGVQKKRRTTPPRKALAVKVMVVSPANSEWNRECLFPTESFETALEDESDASDESLVLNTFVEEIESFGPSTTNAGNVFNKNRELSGDFPSSHNTAPYVYNEERKITDLPKHEEKPFDEEDPLVQHAALSLKPLAVKVVIVSPSTVQRSECSQLNVPSYNTTLRSSIINDTSKYHGMNVDLNESTECAWDRVEVTVEDLEEVLKGSASCESEQSCSLHTNDELCLQTAELRGSEEKFERTSPVKKFDQYGGTDIRRGPLPAQDASEPLYEQKCQHRAEAAARQRRRDYRKLKSAVNIAIRSRAIDTHAILHQQEDAKRTCTLFVTDLALPSTNVPKGTVQICHAKD